MFDTKILIKESIEDGKNSHQRESLFGLSGQSRESRRKIHAFIHKSKEEKERKELYIRFLRDSQEEIEVNDSNKKK